MLPSRPTAYFSLLPEHLANYEAADLYEQLNQTIATEVLETKSGFSNYEISNVMKAECLKIPSDELGSIIGAEVNKLLKENANFL
ncbi:hypothetical protein L195_g036505 [Trifolium pratense]|uniref:Uncharacterized protein n=1 Tax=Trifolium pratense TaxID=57577 RepID=A0A2K3LPS4_TRIPR|nr:hypothetical protein L195_g036505 [Trifolium pratense]